MNPRDSLRKILGLYEHELNGWLKEVLPRVDTVLDVGANEGYFTFGCAAAFRRMNKAGEILAFEPESAAFEKLRAGSQKQQYSEVQVSLHKCVVGSETSSESMTLDEIARQRSRSTPSTHALIKIDVEGAELEVIEGSSLWVNPDNYFLIEVHEESFLEMLTKSFSNCGIRLKQINQQPLPIIGNENRSIWNWWLVSELS